MNNLLQKLCLLIVLGITQFVYAQHHQLTGPNTRTYKFTYDGDASDTIYDHRYAPLNKTVTAYNQFAEKLVLGANDIIAARKVYHGEWRKMKGKWINFYQSGDQWYVPAAELRSVEQQQTKIDQEKVLMVKRGEEEYNSYVREKLLKLGYKVGIGLGIFALLMLLTKSWRKENSEGIFQLGLLGVAVGSIALILCMTPFVIATVLFVPILPVGTLVIWFSREKLILKLLWTIPLILGIVLLVYLDLLELRHFL